jgi:hypothetical protein
MRSAPLNSGECAWNVRFTICFSVAKSSSETYRCFVRNTLLSLDATRSREEAISAYVDRSPAPNFH